MDLTPEVVQSNLDTTFIFFAAVLVFFMHAGFAMLEAGMTRAKSVANIMMKNVMTVALGLLAYFAVGFAFAFGNGSDFIGWEGFFVEGTYEGAFSSLSGYASVDLSAMWFFQAAFAATAATIVSGAMAERTKFKSYLVIAVLMTAIIYPIVVKWQWGGGWLYQLDTPFRDFAGSSLVHLTGGVAALVGVWLLGPRLGKYDKDGRARVIAPHNIPFAVIGTLILWVGWYGFNVGSQLGASGFGPVIVTTTLAAAAGAVVAMLVVTMKFGKPDVGMTANGALAGLVSVTAGAGFVHNWAAIVMGAIGGAIVVFAVIFFDKIRIDDPVGAISVHGVCGAWGTLAVGLFAFDGGLLLGDGASLLVSQLIGVVSIGAFVAIASFILFSAVKATMGLRVDAEEELAGLDVAEHGHMGYGNDLHSSVSVEEIVATSYAGSRS